MGLDKQEGLREEEQEEDAETTEEEVEETIIQMLKREMILKTRLNE